jgi:hypothetical protein
MTTLETLEAIDDLAERYGVPFDQWCAFKGDVLEFVRRIEAVSRFCPECGCDDLINVVERTEPGHLYCANCKQEMFVTVDYSTAIRANLAERKSLEQRVSDLSERVHNLTTTATALRQEVNYWIENGCIPPPSTDELKGYACYDCRTRGVKLWRTPHSGEVLKCASCLSPGKLVGDDGRQESEYGPMTDQVCDWLPAVPKADTFYGYSRVPPQAVGWWRGLPTYLPHITPIQRTLLDDEAA